MASEQGHLEIVRILILNHARVDVFDEVVSSNYISYLYMHITHITPYIHYTINYTTHIILHYTLHTLRYTILATLHTLHTHYIHTALTTLHTTLHTHYTTLHTLHYTTLHTHYTTLHTLHTHYTYCTPNETISSSLQYSMEMLLCIWLQKMATKRLQIFF